MKKIKITFFKVKDNGVKIQWICKKAQDSFQHEKKLLIMAPNLQAAHYLDTLLWNFSEECFITHLITDSATPEWIAITIQDQLNVNQAPRLFNLCPAPSPLYPELEEIFEFYDESQPEKLALSQKRLQHYQSNGLIIKMD